VKKEIDEISVRKRNGNGDDENAIHSWIVYDSKDIKHCNYHINEHVDKRALSNQLPRTSPPWDMSASKLEQLRVLPTEEKKRNKEPNRRVGRNAPPKM